MTTDVATVQVWADIRCPWCWIGHRRLSRAIAATDVPAGVEYRSFLLEPDGPEDEGTVGEAAVTTWGMSELDWGARLAQIERGGRSEGLAIRMNTARLIDSRPAHRVLKLARERQLDQTAAWDAMFAAHLEYNVDLESWETLATVGQTFGLTREEVDELSDSDHFLDEVSSDHADARRRGIAGVPAVAVGHAAPLTGTHSVERLVTFLDTEFASNI